MAAVSTLIYLLVIVGVMELIDSNFKASTSPLPFVPLALLYSCWAIILLVCAAISYAILRVRPRSDPTRAKLAVLAGCLLAFFGTFSIAPHFLSNRNALETALNVTGLAIAVAISLPMWLNFWAQIYKLHNASDVDDVRLILDNVW